MKRDLRVVIDARHFTHPQPGGFKTYIRALLTGLRERNIDGVPIGSIVLYVDRPLTASSRDCLPPGANVKVLNPSRIRTDLLDFGRELKCDAPDIVMGTANYLPSAIPRGMRKVVTIHDALGIKRYPFVRIDPTPRERFVNWYWERMTRKSAARADRIITVSQSAAEELRECMPRIRAERVAVVYNGIASPEPRAAVMRQENVVLALSSPDPRKNMSLLYGAFSRHVAEFKANSHRLDIVCTSETSRSRAEAAMEIHGIKNYRLATDPSDQDLSDLYARATVFAWPSRREGFGMPPMEAMRCGCPVVSSSAPAMPEILGDAPEYFDELDDAVPLANALARLLGDRELREVRSAKGKQHAAQFTCLRMAAQTLEVWESVGASQ